MTLFNPFRTGTLRISRHFQALLLALFVLAGTAQAQNVTMTPAGPGAPYASLAAAFVDINSGAVTGAITIAINNSYAEPAGSAVLNSSGAGAASYTSVTIQPSADGVVITGTTVAGRGVIELNGADNVTINGDNPNTGGTNRNLTITNAAANTVAFTSLVRVATSTLVTTANSISISNCILNGNATGRNVSGTASTTGSENTTYGVISSAGASTVAATTAPSALTSLTTSMASGQTANNLSVNNCQINACSKGIAVNSAAIANINSLTITNNLIGDATPGNTTTVYTQAITAQGFASANISGNTIRNIESFVGSSTGVNTLIGIGLGNIATTSTGTNALVENNTISRVYCRNTGTWPSTGIYLNLSSASNSTVRNNFITDIQRDITSATGFSAALNAGGIKIIGGNTYTVVHNSVNLFGTWNGVGNNTSSTCFLVATTAQTNVNVRNNIFSNTVLGGGTGTAHCCVILPTGGTSAMNYVQNNNAMYCSSGTNQFMAHNGFSFVAGNAYSAANFIPGSTAPATNWRAYTSTLNSAGTNDNASFGTTTAVPFVSTADLHISGTPVELDNTGANAAITTDIDGQYRSNPPDIGADEFTTQPCASATATVNYVQDCGNNQFFLDVTVTALNGSSSVDVRSDFAGEPGSDLGVGLGTFQIGPFPSNTNVQVILTSNTSPLCDATIGTYNFDCSTNGQNALSFDGANDRVDVPASASLSITGTAFTVEAWIYPTAFSTAGEHGGSIVNKEGPAGAGFMLRCGGNGILGFSAGVGTFPVVTSPAGTLVLNQWQHVAGIYDGVNMRIYKDGVQVGSAAQAAAMIPSAAVNVAIGNWINGNDRGFTGKIDEVRIWSVARTVPQLNTTMNNVLCGTETGLQAYYQLNQGTAAGNNAGITSAPDLTANANNGTANNMALTGPTSNWLVGKTGLGACLNCTQPLATATVQQDCANSQFFINVVVSDLSGNTSVDVLSNFGGNPGGQTGVGTGTYQLGPFTSNTNVQVNVNPTGFPACNLVVGTYTYDCSTFGQNALSFDGADDKVDCGNSASLQITGTQLTLEAWIYPTAWRTSSFQGSIINKEGINFQGYMIRCGNNGQLSFNLGMGATPWVEVQSATGVLTLNTWQHVAATYDGANLRIFKNGVQVGVLASSLSIDNAATSPVTIGNWSQDLTRGFPGKIDEARIWNIALSEATIATQMNTLYCGNESGLVGYWQFNQGVADENNAGVTTLTDLALPADDGTLTGFTLNGPSSNWVLGKTGLGACVPQTCFAPVGGLTVSGLSTTGATINWTDNGSAGYDWEIRTSGLPGSGPAGLVDGATNVSGTPAITTLLAANNTYTAYVRSSCTSPTATSIWIQVTFNTNTPTCIANPTAPTNGGTICQGASVTLSWPAAPSATSYSIIIDGGTPIVQAGTSYVAVLGGGAHTWSVVPSNALGGPVSCADWTFTVTAAPDGDTFSNAIVIPSLSSTFTSTGNNNLAANCYTNSQSFVPGRDKIWSVLTSPCTTQLTIGLCGSTGDSHLIVFAADQTTVVADNDDCEPTGCAGTLSSSIGLNASCTAGAEDATPLTVTPNTLYYIVMAGHFVGSDLSNFTLTVAADCWCSAPTASVAAITGTCPTFTIPVNVTSTGSTGTANISYTVDGGSPVVVPGVSTGITVIPTAGSFSQGSVVAVTVLTSDNTCSTSLGQFVDNCPIDLVCGTTYTGSHCYTNTDTRTFTFTSPTPGETVTVSFISGSMDPNDLIRAYDGTDNTGEPLDGFFGGNPAANEGNLFGTFADLAGATATSYGQSIYIEIESDGSNSCADTQQSTWVFQAQCTVGCIQPNATITPNVDCALQSFTLDVNVTDNGDASTMTLEYTVNGGTETLVPNLVLNDLVNIGPFNLSDVIHVRLLHDGDPSCDRNFGDIIVPLSACPNDDPCQARPVAVNPNYTCTLTSNGDMTGSTLTAGITGGCTGVTRDVWFRFVATAPTHRIQLGGNITGLSHSLYTGATCSALTLVSSSTCTAGATISQPNGLVTGQTYYVRVSRTTVGTNLFTVCVSAPPAADIGQNALSFDGVANGGNDRVDCGIAPSIDITGTQITVEAWIYPTAWRTSEFQGNIVNKEGGFQGYMLRAGNNGQLGFHFGTGTGWVDVTSVTGALTLNTWQHVAGTYDGANVFIYRDGVQIGTIASTASIVSAPTQQLTIGNWSQDNTRGFVGKIDEVRIWNSTLSAATLAANMNQQYCGGEVGLQAYYHFNYGVDGGVNTGLTSLPDASGNANNGTLANFALTGPTSNWVQGKTGMTPCAPCNEAPDPGAIGGTSPACSGVAHSLSVLGASTGSGISYQWYYGPVGSPMTNMLGTTASQSTASIPLGTWEMVVDVTCAGFGTEQTAVYTFVKNPTPTAVPSSGVACTTQALNLTGTSDIGTTFTWTGPNSFASTDQNPIVPAITAAAAGTYTFNASFGGCTGTGTVAVTVRTTPTITSLTAIPNPVCIGANSQLNVAAPVAPYVIGAPGSSFIDISATGTPVPSVPNTLGDDSEHAITLPSFTYNGIAYTTALVGNNGAMVFGVSTGTITFTNATLGTTTFGGAGGIGLAPHWDDLVPDGAAGASIRTEQVGNLFIIQWTREGHLTLATGQNITFQVQLDLVSGAIHFAYSDVLFGGSQVALDRAGSATVGIQWNTSGSGFLLHSFNTVSLTDGQVISFVPNTVNFNWTNPGGYLTATNIANPIAQNVAATQTYAVTATSTGNGCVSAPSQITLTANPPIGPTQAVINPAYMCGGGSVTLTAVPLGGGAPYTFTWTDPNNVTGAPSASPTVTATIAGTWSVSISDACGAIATTSLNLVNYPIPVASASSNAPVCSGASINLNGGSDQPGSTFAWSGPGGYTSNVEDPVRTGATLAMIGSYSVIATANGCASAPASTSVGVNVTPSVPVVTPPSAVILPGGNVNLVASSTALTTLPVSGGAIALPAGAPTTSTGIAGPYPSAITVAGLPTTGVTVKQIMINGFSHTFVADLDMLLSSPTNTNVVIMSDAGGFTDFVGLDIVLQDGAPAIPAQLIASGTYAPTVDGVADTYPAPAPAANAASALSSFTGDPNGVWNLYINDDASGDFGSITSWAIVFEYNNVSFTWTPPASGLDTYTGPSVIASPATSTTYTVTAANGSCTSSANVLVQVASNNLVLEVETDGFGAETTWEIRVQGTNALAASGGGSYPDNALYNDPINLPNGCYYLVVFDGGGNGITGGGYVLREGSGMLRRIIDDRDNFSSGGTSQIAANEGFCLPIGNDRLIVTSCDKLDWRTGEYIVATDNPAVTTIWNSFPAGSTQRATTGYEMWWYNPNGGYSFRKYQSHNNANGITASATRACHFNINAWTGNQLQTNVLYNVRVRSRVLGVNSEWGAACRFILDPVRAQCPLTKLFDDAGSQYLSCGATRGIGSGSAFLVHARPVNRYLNGVSTAANRYQFRFVTDGGGTTIVKTSATGQYWVNTLGLTACKDYDVEVRASFNNGSTWCDTYAASNPYAPKWGQVCVLHTSGCPAGNGGGQNISMEEGSDAAGLRMFPNPNRGDQVMLSLDVMAEDVTTVSVDIFDMFGKRVDTRTIAVQDHFLNASIDLNGALAAGMYMVNITAGETVYTERLVIQP